MQSKFYFIYATCHIEYDSYDSFVIEARNEAEAREIAGASAGDEGSEVWFDEEKSKIEELIPSTTSTGIILGSFNAG